MNVRVALVAETFLPQMNGVVGSVLHAVAHLRERGDEVLIIAPRHAGAPESVSVSGARVERVPSAALPGYRDLRLGLASVPRMTAVLRDFAPDVVHLASPFLLGWQALRAAEQCDLPVVAVYQTDVPSYAERYGVPGLATAFTRHVVRLHERASITLAPSSAAIDWLRDQGVPRVRLWGRGVDGTRFHPLRRSEPWRRALAPGGELLIGYVGRLAPEKQVRDLAAIASIPGTRLVIIGDGPERAALEQLLPGAAFLGFLQGEELARAVASLDVFVHPGEHETFCQTVQEALASGVPVVATGRGGPVDLVDSSRTGWLYRPGDLVDLRDRVLDLVGDDRKRAAFALAARDAVAHRTWHSLGEQLRQHYADARREHGRRPAPAPGLAKGDPAA